MWFLDESCLVYQTYYQPNHGHLLYIHLVYISDESKGDIHFWDDSRNVERSRVCYNYFSYFFWFTVVGQGNLCTRNGLCIHSTYHM